MKILGKAVLTLIFLQLLQITIEQTPDSTAATDPTSSTSSGSTVSSTPDTPSTITVTGTTSTGSSTSITVTETTSTASSTSITVTETTSTASSTSTTTATSSTSTATPKSSSTASQSTTDVTSSTTTVVTTTPPCTDCTDIDSNPHVFAIDSKNASFTQAFRPLNTELHAVFMLLSPGTKLFENNAELLIYSGYESNPSAWEILAIYNATTIANASKVVATNNPGETFSISYKNGDNSFRAAAEEDSVIQYSIVALNMTIFNNPDMNITGVYDVNLTAGLQPFVNSTSGYPNFYYPKTDEIFRYFPMDSSIYILFYLTNYGNTFEDANTTLSVYTGDVSTNPDLPPIHV